MWFVPFTPKDFIDILLVAIIMYWIYRATKGTNAPYIFTGIIAIYLLWVVVKAFGMELLSTILGQVISVGTVALIVVFQPEVRRFLQMIGMRRRSIDFLSNVFGNNTNSLTTNLDPIVTACEEMSQEKVGALIVISRHSDLQLIADGGIAIDSKLSSQLLTTIFFKNTSLHDGAVIVDNDRVVAARCILPVTQSEVPKSYGTRHRSAIGLSEISDAVVVVVSEETGRISIAENGELHRNITPSKLKEKLVEILSIKLDTRSEVSE